MIQLIALFLLLWFAINTTVILHHERSVFWELGETLAARWLVWLFPLPFVLPFLHHSFTRALFFPVPLGALFFLPAMLAAARNRKRFDRVEASAVKAAAAAVDQLITVGVIGIMGTFLFTIVLWVHKR